MGALNSNCKFEFGTTPAPLAKIASGETPNPTKFKRLEPTVLLASKFALLLPFASFKNFSVPSI